MINQSINLTWCVRMREIALFGKIFHKYHTPNINKSISITLRLFTNRFIKTNTSIMRLQVQ